MIKCSLPTALKQNTGYYLAYGNHSDKSSPESRGKNADLKWEEVLTRQVKA
jgi:hypothetical protein